MKRDTRLSLALIACLFLDRGVGVVQASSLPSGSGTETQARGRQQTEAPVYSERIDVALVNVDVIVTDGDGKRVRGLKAEDFTILEEGKPQQIANFAEYAAAAETVGVSVEGPAPKATTAEPPPRQQRTFLVFVDEMALIAAKEDFRPALTDVLTKALQPGDIGAVLSWTNRLNVRQGFTGDVDAMLGAIEKLPAPGPVFSADGTFQTIREDDAYWRSIAADPRSGVSAVEGGPLAQMIRESSATTSYLDMKSKVRAVNAAMSAMAGAQGRKVLLLVTHRFSRIAGREFSLAARSVAMPPTPAERAFDAMGLVQSVAETANATGFTVYGLYPEGVRATLDGAENSEQVGAGTPPLGARDHMIVMNETESLQLVADRTGGDYAIGSDALKLLPRVTEDLTDYYSLAYRTRTRGTDNQRRISVRVRNRAYRVRARTQVAERSDATRMKDRVTAAVFAPIDPGVIPIEATLGAPNEGKLPLSIRIPISALTTTQKGGVHTGAFTVYLAWNSSGTISDISRNTQPFTITAADLERAKTSHFKYALDVRIDDSTRALGVGVLDETSKEYGAVTVNIPRNERL